MIKKRQRRFVISSMSLLFVVLALIVTVMGIISYNNVICDADKVLDVLSKNEGRFPMEPEKFGQMLPPEMSLEIPYESRYFSVVLDRETSSVVYVETSRIFAIDTSEAILYAGEVLNRNRTSGFLENFRYSKIVDENKVQIIFLDCGRRLDAFWDFLITSIAITFLGYLLVFVLVAYFSQHIMRPISESYEKQKRFITDAGHEIKTPLTIINANADVLEMEFGENEWIDDIRRQAKRLTALTNDLVYLARMEEAEQTLQMIEFPLSDMMDEWIPSFQRMAQAEGISFSCNIQPMLSLYGNEQSIQQLVTILLDNAVKYTPKDGKIEVVVEKIGKTIRLVVYNTTKYPVQPEYMELLFERFYRTDPSRSSQTGGHGIGLSIAKAIVNSHNGKIQATTEDRYSLQMTVTLPM